MCPHQRGDPSHCKWPSVGRSESLLSRLTQITNDYSEFNGHSCSEWEENARYEARNLHKSDRISSRQQTYLQIFSDLNPALLLL